MKVKCGDGTMKDAVICCNHVIDGALTAYVVAPSIANDWLGEALCGRCSVLPSEDTKDYQLACWECVERKIQ